MPLLTWPHRGAETVIPPALEARGLEPVPAPRRGLLARCTNPWCRSGWLQLWRSRSTPVFEGGWTCSHACTEVRMELAVRRALDGRAWTSEPPRPRIPLGLLMLEQGWITSEDLRQALAAQRAAGSGSLGAWLVRRNAVAEQTVTRALALQWSCPVLAAEPAEAASLAAVLPRLFVDAFGALPLRLAGGLVIYLGFEQRPDPVLALALEQMNGLQVESGIVSGSHFRPAQARMLEAEFPHVELIEAASAEAAARALARAVERVQPAASRLVRVHGCLWLRLWRRAPAPAVPEVRSVEDVICTIGGV
jgi:hypothetical protein